MYSAPRCDVVLHHVTACAVQMGGCMAPGGLQCQCTFQVESQLWPLWFQTEANDGGIAGIEEGRAALRRQLDSQASGLSAADRAASAPTSAGALAAAGSAHADAGAAQRAGSARPPGSRKPPKRKRSRAARQGGEPGAGSCRCGRWPACASASRPEDCQRFSTDRKMLVLGMYTP